MGKDIQVGAETTDAQAQAPRSTTDALAAQALAAASERELDPVARVKAAILKRAKRGSRVGALANKLAARAVPGFHLRWVSKDVNEIARRADVGYVFVNRDSGLPVDLPAVPSEGMGSAAERPDLVLMACPEELVLERQKTEQALVDRRERALKRTLEISVNQKNTSGVQMPLDGELRIAREAARVIA